MKRNIDKLGKRCRRRVDMRPVRASRSNDLSGKMLAAVFTLMCVAMPVLCSADTPIAVSVFKTFPDHASVCGAHLSPIAVDGPDRVAGLSFGGINSLVTREVRGLQLSGIASWGHPDGPKETLVYGGQIAGAFTGTDQLVGIQVAGIFSGADDMTGVQLSGLSSRWGITESVACKSRDCLLSRKPARVCRWHCGTDRSRCVACRSG